jgi:TolA-binding protein
MLNNVITQYPDSVFSAEAKLRLGIARFNEENYTSAIPLFEDLMKTKPRMIEDSPDLLQYLGNAYYYTGNKAAAKDALIKLYNLYPGIEGRDTILTRVGDSLAETGQKDKAVKVYKLVQNKFPGTDGYVISTMRLAEYLTDRNEKVKMYNTIINDFAANPLARLAMLRLAMLQGETGDFEKSVETIKTLLASQPKVLKKDAMNLLQNSSAEIFKKLLEEDQYTELIGRYESDRKILEESSDPEFFNRVGTAYLRAHLYKNASDILAKAYYRTRAKDRSPDLVYNLAVSLDESGRKDESIDMLKSYNKLFPDGPQASDVNARMGAIFLLKENPRQAVACYRTAVEKAPDAGGRAALLISLADSQGAMGDVSGAVKTLNGAVEMLASQPEDEFDVLIRVFKSLGTYAMKLGDWGKAADSFASAIRFAGKNEDTTELYFRMGDAYMKARKTDAAEKAYNSVIEKGDSLWGGMAKERLRTMKLREKLDKT